METPHGSAAFLVEMAVIGQKQTPPNRRAFHSQPKSAPPGVHNRCNSSIRSVTEFYGFAKL